MNSENRVGIPSGVLVRVFENASRIGCYPIFWKIPDLRALSSDVKADVDLLIHKRDRSAFHAVLEEQGIFKVCSRSWRSIDNVSDYFGCSENGESLLHIQVYDEITLGKSGGDQLTLSEVNDSYDNMRDRQARFSSYSDACVLRICSASMLHLYQKKQVQKYIKESRLYRKYCSLDELNNSVDYLVGMENRESLFDILEEGVGSAAHLKVLRQTLIRSGKTRFKPFSKKEWLVSMISGLNRRTCKFPVLARREGVGRVVVILGSDGSGKSTLSRKLVDYFDHKIDSRLMYFGTGNGPSSFHRKPFLLAQALVKLVKPTDVGAGKSSNTNTDRQSVPGTGLNRVVKDIVRGLWGISVAFERSAKLKRCEKMRKRGFLVVTDRFPQMDFPGIHDGPRLNSWFESGSGLRKRIATWERSVYRKISDYTVDQVIFLDVDIPTAMARRPEESEQELTRRIHTIRKISIASKHRVRIDAALPFQQVQHIAVNTVLENFGGVSA